jgi:hypothetical protein
MDRAVASWLLTVGLSVVAEQPLRIAPYKGGYALISMQSLVRLRRRRWKKEQPKNVIETLGEDFKRCFEGLSQSFDDGTLDEYGYLDAYYEFHARQLIRAVFAYIEGVTFSVKITAARDCMQRGIDISPQERYIAAEVDYELNEKVEVVERPARISLSSNIRFAFALSEKARELSPQFDASAEWWFCLREQLEFATGLCTQECLRISMFHQRN